MMFFIKTGLKKLYRPFHRLNAMLAVPWLWMALSAGILFWYLSPLLLHADTCNILIYDNLDSNVVWLKILAESGKIFAPNSAVIPNMMGGLPRLSYGSEYNVLLWLYYFFTPVTAYVINVTAIHLTAFTSMYLLLQHYVVPKRLRMRTPVVYLGALLFALQPFWPSAGLSIAAMPLVTYLLVKIYSGKAKWYGWTVFLMLPLYTSFVFVYCFYLGFAFVFAVSDSAWHRRINGRFLLALSLMTVMYLSVEYRLVLATFFDDGFVSHRNEFHIFFTEPFIEATRRFFLFFLDGHLIHLRGMQMPLLLPLVLFAWLLRLFGRRLSASESVVIVMLFALSIWTDIWKTMLGSVYGIPAVIVIVVAYALHKRRFSRLDIAILAYTAVSTFYGYMFYEGLGFIANWFPIFKSFSLARAAFVQPLVFGIMVALALEILVRRLHFQVLLLLLLAGVQYYIASIYSWHRLERYSGSATFDSYYVPALFGQLKKEIPEPLEKVCFVSFGIEPAVALYNGLYTVDGYCVNYPLAYKKRFDKVNEGYPGAMTDEEGKNYTGSWGSKLYIMSIASSLEKYRKGTWVDVLNFDETALRDLGADYLISSYRLTYPQDRKLMFIKRYSGEEDSWDLFLYRFGRD
jgi:hypothetical protein